VWMPRAGATASPECMGGGRGGLDVRAEGLVQPGVAVGLAEGGMGTARRGGHCPG